MTRRASGLLFIFILVTAGLATVEAGRSVDLDAGANAMPVVDRAALSTAGLGDAVTLDLPGGSVTGQVTWRKDHSPGRFVIAGGFDDSLGSFTLASNGEALYGHLRRPGRPVLVLRTVAGAEMRVEEVDTAAPFCDLGEQRFDPGPTRETGNLNDHLLRDAFGADLVAFVEDNGASVTYGLESLDPAHEAQAFALTPYSNFSNTVMSHELGHQMGCCHALGERVSKINAVFGGTLAAVNGFVTLAKRIRASCGKAWVRS